MNERDGASASLTSGGLRALIAAPKELVSYIQGAFTLKDGSCISQAQAGLFAMQFITHFVQRGTCAVALPAAPRCMRVCVWPCVCVCVWARAFVGLWTLCCDQTVDPKARITPSQIMDHPYAWRWLFIVCTRSSTHAAMQTPAARPGGYPRRPFLHATCRRRATNWRGIWLADVCAVRSTWWPSPTASRASPPVSPGSQRLPRRVRRRNRSSAYDTRAPCSLGCVAGRLAQRCLSRGKWGCLW